MSQQDEKPHSPRKKSPSAIKQKKTNRDKSSRRLSKDSETGKKIELLDPSKNLTNKDCEDNLRKSKCKDDIKISKTNASSNNSNDINHATKRRNTRNASLHEPDGNDKEKSSCRDLGTSSHRRDTNATRKSSCNELVTLETSSSHRRRSNGTRKSSCKDLSDLDTSSSHRRKGSTIRRSSCKDFGTSNTTRRASNGARKNNCKDPRISFSKSSRRSSCSDLIQSPLSRKRDSTRRSSYDNLPLGTSSQARNSDDTPKNNDTWPQTHISTSKRKEGSTPSHRRNSSVVRKSISTSLHGLDSGSKKKTTNRRASLSSVSDLCNDSTEKKNRRASLSSVSDLCNESTEKFSAGKGDKRLDSSKGSNEMLFIHRESKDWLNIMKKLESECHKSTSRIDDYATEKDIADGNNKSTYSINGCEVENDIGDKKFKSTICMNDCKTNHVTDNILDDELLVAFKKRGKNDECLLDSHSLPLRLIVGEMNAAQAMLKKLDEFEESISEVEGQLDEIEKLSNSFQIKDPFLKNNPYEDFVKQRCSTGDWQKIMDRVGTKKTPNYLKASRHCSL